MRTKSVKCHESLRPCTRIENPRATPPKGTDEYIRWLGGDTALFQQEHPDLPQSRKLNARDMKKVINAWNKAREAAELEDAGKVSPEWQETVRKFHRTRTITAVSASKKKGTRATKK